MLPTKRAPPKIYAAEIFKLQMIYKPGTIKPHPAATPGVSPVLCGSRAESGFYSFKWLHGNWSYKFLHNMVKVDSWPTGAKTLSTWPLKKKVY